MTEPTELPAEHKNRVDVGWRGSVVLPGKKRDINVLGVAGSQTAAQKLQKEEEDKLGVSRPDVKALREKRRADGSLAASNRGVNLRDQQDKDAILTEADRHYILEEKARTYSALQAGTQYDDAAIYHVKFRPGGQLSEEELPPGPVPPEFELQRMEQGQINWQGDMQSSDMKREQQRQQWEAEEGEALADEWQKDATRDAKVEGIRVMAKLTADDRAAAAKARAGQSQAVDEETLELRKQAAKDAAKMLDARRHQKLVWRALRKQQPTVA